MTGINHTTTAASPVARATRFLTNSKTLWISFGLTLLMTIAFGVVMAVYDFSVIDEMSVAAEIREHIAAMTVQQRNIHAWMTGTLDVAYPLAYSTFFMGVALRFFKGFRYWLALPSLIVVPFDLTEGFAQIMLLTGSEGFMDLKVVATQGKLALFIAGLCITLCGLLLGLKRYLSKR